MLASSNISLRNLQAIFYKAETISILASILAILSVVFYLPSMPALEKSLPIDRIVTQKSIAYFVLGQAFLPLVLGYFSDLYGVKKIMVISMGLLFLTFIAIIYSHNSFVFLVWRFFQGGFSQAGITISRVMLREKSSYRKTVIILSWLGVIQSITHVLGPFLGGLIVSKFNWSVNFLLLAIIALLIMFLSHKWSEPRRRVDYTNIPFIREILISRDFLILSGIVATLHLVTIYFFTMSPFYFIEHLNVSPEMFGFYLGLTSIGYAAGSFSMSRYLNCTNHHNLVFWCLWGSLLCGLLTLIGPIFNMDVIPILIFTQFAYSFLKAVISPILQASALGIFPQRKATCSSIFNFISTVAAPIGGLIAANFQGKLAVIVLAILIVLLSLTDMLIFALIKRPLS